jgi:general secretion pathway protein C
MDRRFEAGAVRDRAGLYSRAYCKRRALGAAWGAARGMGRIAIWTANTVLTVLCCWLAARILLRVVDAALVPDAGPAVVAASPVVPAIGTPDRSVIVSRNLFNVSTVVDVPPPVDEEEELEATKLPLRLLGTAASPEGTVSWAAVEDLETRKHQVVRVQDSLKTAKVIRIERRRIVLENGSRREELALEDELGAGSAVRASFTPPAPDLSARVQKLAENRFAVSRDEVQNAARNPAALFQQARILPKYENGQMVGVQLNAIKPGSMFEQVGLRSGDTITSFNGVTIDNPEASASLLQELSSARRFEVGVKRADGREDQVTYEFRE